MPTEKLTKRRALELTKELWIWLAAHPKKDKEDWPGWKELGAIADWGVTYRYECPCCEFMLQHTVAYNYFPSGLSCRECPLISCWPTPKDIEDEYGDNPCQRDGSAFEEWCEALAAEDIIKTKQSAQQMVDYCEKALAELKDA